MTDQEQKQPPCSPPGEDSAADLDSKLKKLEDDLLLKQEALQNADVAINERQEQIKTLKTLINGIDSAADTYRQRYSELKERESDYKKFCDDEKTCLTNVLGEHTGQVCKIANDVMAEIVEIGKGIEELEVGCKDEKSKLEIARRARAKSARKLAKAKKAFEAWKDPIKAIEARFKDLEKLKKEICVEHEAKNYAIAYYLLMFGHGDCASVPEDESCKFVEEEFFRSFEKYCVHFSSPEDYPPEIVDPADLKGKVVAAWTEYQTADAAYNGKDADVRYLEKKLELIKAQLEGRKKSFEDTIRRKLRELNQPQPAVA